MSESHGDPTPHPAAPVPEPVHPAPPVPLTPAPRANPPSVFNPKDTPAPAAAPAGFSDFVTWMQSITGAPAAPPPAGNPEGRTLLPKTQKKFHRYDPDAPRPDPAAPAPDAPAAAEAAEESGGPANRTMPRTLLPAASSGPAPVVRRRRPKPVAGAAEGPALRFPWRLLSVAALLAGSFFYGRKTAFDAASSKAAPPPARVSLDRSAGEASFAGLFNEAMSAEARRDYPQAARLLEQARQNGSRTTGIDYQLALLAFESGNFPGAMSLLNHSMDVGEEVAASYELRGLLNNRTSGINRGLADLETATRLEPFNARYFYFTGEALRRNGKPQAALTYLLHAADRLREPELEGLYNLKVRLTQIELGQENDFANQLDAALKLEPPPVDWLFTAAAVELHRGRFDAAAGFLDKIVAVTDERTVNSRLRDYFFYGFANEKSLARFYAGIHRAEAAAKAAHVPPPTLAQPLPTLPAAPPPQP